MIEYDENDKVINPWNPIENDPYKPGYFLVMRSLNDETLQLTVALYDLERKRWGNQECDTQEGKIIGWCELPFIRYCAIAAHDSIKEEVNNIRDIEKPLSFMWKSKNKDEQ
jgi:hypothetical protein